MLPSVDPSTPASCTPISCTPLIRHREFFYITSTIDAELHSNDGKASVDVEVHATIKIVLSMQYPINDSLRQCPFSIEKDSTHMKGSIGGIWEVLHPDQERLNDVAGKGSFTVKELAVSGHFSTSRSCPTYAQVGSKSTATTAGQSTESECSDVVPEDIALPSHFICEEDSLNPSNHGSRTKQTVTIRNVKDSLIHAGDVVCLLRPTILGGDYSILLVHRLWTVEDERSRFCILLRTSATSITIENVRHNPLNMPGFVRKKCGVINVICTQHATGRHDPASHPPIPQNGLLSSSNIGFVPTSTNSFTLRSMSYTLRQWPRHTVLLAQYCPPSQLLRAL